MFLFTSIVVILGVTLADDPFRPQYHLMPPSNWLNDPNGPVYFNGYYHMFYQYYPNPVPTGQKYWGHCYSKDMVHWIRLPIALTPDQPYDINGVWTGSTTIVNGTPVIIYTGISSENQEVQCQARPTNLFDPTLTNWTKSSFNPLITYPDGRDPATAFQDNQNNYYLIYGSGTQELGGQAVLFTSKDFINWTYLHPIHSNHYDGFWECPDIFNLSTYTVLKASLLGHDFWTLGKIDPIQLIFTPINHDLGEFIQLIDNGKFYASKTFYDPINHQQVIMGWTDEEDGQGAQRGWQGLLTLPRAIFLSDVDLEIRTRPIDELKTLRDPNSHQQITDLTIPSEISFASLGGFYGDQMEILVDWQFPMNQNLDFGLCVFATDDGAERTSIGITTRNNTSLIMNWDLPGWNYLSVPDITQWSNCEVACENDNRCQCWTFDTSEQINNNCFLKSGIPLLVSKSVSISGVKQGENNQQAVWIYIDRHLSQSSSSPPNSSVFGVIWMDSTSSSLASLKLDIFVDHSVIEVFEPQNGRLAITTRVYPDDEEAKYVGVFANQIPMNNDTIIIKTFDMWYLNSIWTSNSNEYSIKQKKTTVIFFTVIINFVFFLK